MRISDWSSDVCCSDLSALLLSGPLQARNLPTQASSVIDATVITHISSPLLGQLPAFNPAPALTQSVAAEAGAVVNRVQPAGTAAVGEEQQNGRAAGRGGVWQEVRRRGSAGI